VTKLHHLIVMHDSMGNMIQHTITQTESYESLVTWHFAYETLCLLDSSPTHWTVHLLDFT